MPIVQDPILQINGIETKYVSGTFEHSKGVPTRNVNVDSGKNPHTTENVETAKGTISFEFYSNPENETLFNNYVANGTNNVITFIRGNLNTNGSNMTVINTDVKIKYGPDETFIIEFEGNPLVE